MPGAVVDTTGCGAAPLVPGWLPVVPPPGAADPPGLADPFADGLPLAVAEADGPADADVWSDGVAPGPFAVASWCEDDEQLASAMHAAARMTRRRIRPSCRCPGHDSASGCFAGIVHA